MILNIKDLITKYFPKESLARHYYLNHVEAVMQFALEICRLHPELHADTKIVKEGALLHDIGICRVHAPNIGCYGDHPYICHGILGAEIVMNELHDPILSQICITHVGIGITIQDIEKQNLPLPKQNMIPQTIEEKIVCYADKFFSKSEKHLTAPKTVEEIRKKLPLLGEGKLETFNAWTIQFGVPKYKNN